MRYSLKEILENVSILSTHGLLLLGADDTTGFGKSSFAKRLATEWSVAKTLELGRHANTAKVHWSNTLDDLRELAIAPGAAIVMDELQVACADSVQYIGEGILKSVLDPTAGCSVRCRGRNAFFPPNTARIITANAASAVAWCGARLRWTEPLQRKCIVVVIDRPVVVPRWSSQTTGISSSAVFL